MGVPTDRKLDLLRKRKASDLGETRIQGSMRRAADVIREERPAISSGETRSRGERRAVCKGEATEGNSGAKGGLVIRF